MPFIDQIVAGGVAPGESTKKNKIDLTSSRQSGLIVLLRQTT